MKNLTDYINENRVNESKVNADSLKDDIMLLFDDWMDSTDSRRQQKAQIEQLIDDPWEYYDDILRQLESDYDWDREELENYFDNEDTEGSTISSAAEEWIDNN